MPAPTYQDLYQFRENIEAAQSTILTADVAALIGADDAPDPDAFIFGPLGTADLPSSRIEFAASAFKQASVQQIPATSNGQYYFCHYSGEISFTVVTPRQGEDGEPSAYHGARTGRIMFLMQPIAARFTSANLPYYEILSLQLSNTPTPIYDVETQTDRTEITFAVEIWIRPGAFPAVVP